MTKFGIMGATALSLSLAIAAPALAQQGPRAGSHAAAGPTSGHMGRAAMGAGPRMGAAPGAQANLAAQGSVRSANFTRGAQVAQGDRGVLGGGQFRNRDGGFRRGAGFAAGAAAAGVVTGAAIAAGGYGYGYDPYYYGDQYAYGPGYDSYAFDTGPTVAFEQPVPVEGPVVGDASYCAQRFRSYDPASGTYLGYDGLRHPCP
jgi:BA14K-like protein